MKRIEINLNLLKTFSNIFIRYYDKQSLEKNAVNRLIDYAKFILDLYSNSTSHFETDVFIKTLH